MQVLRQMPHHIPAPNPLTACGKTLYAQEKMKEAMRNYGQTIAPSAPPKHKAKVVVLGDSGVGKTSLIYRHEFGGQFAPVSSTIGASFVSSDVKTDKRELIRLQVWDTAGQERFRCMVPMYMRNADAALIIYDVTNRESFDSVERWVKELERSVGTDETIIYLVANKTDLVEKRVVTEAEGKAEAVKLNAKFLEVSSSQPDVFSQFLSEVGGDVLFKRENPDCIDEMTGRKKKIFGEKDENANIIVIKGGAKQKLNLLKSKCCSFV